jgi:hypothetical protein
LEKSIPLPHRGLFTRHIGKKHEKFNHSTARSASLAEQPSLSEWKGEFEETLPHGLAFRHPGRIRFFPDRIPICNSASSGTFSF